MLLNHIAAGFCWVDPPQPDRNHETRLASSRFYRRRVTPPSAAFRSVRREKNGRQRRSICTADELHRVVVSNSDWKLALWRYLPSPEVPLFSSSQIFAFCEYPFGNALIYSFRGFRVLNSLVIIEGGGVERYKLSYVFCRHRRGITRFCCCQGLLPMQLAMISLLR